MSDAEVARANGWTVGTRLVGDEGYGPSVIEITAIGQRTVLAYTVSHRGQPSRYREAVWTFRYRDWQAAA